MQYVYIHTYTRTRTRARARAPGMAWSSFEVICCMWGMNWLGFKSFLNLEANAPGSCRLWHCLRLELFVVCGGSNVWFEKLIQPWSKHPWQFPVAVCARPGKVGAQHAAGRRAAAPPLACAATAYAAERRRHVRRGPETSDILKALEGFGRFYQKS